MTTTAGPPVLVTADPEIRDAVLATAAALECEVEQVEEPARLPAVWRAAPRLLVGSDLAEQVATQLLPPRPGVHLIAAPESEVERWSMELGAPVLRLPGQRTLLARALGDAATGSGRALVLVGASGGVGVSTLAAGVAHGCGSGGALLVDLDECGGGADLLLGLEADPGWRWSDLGGARGDVGSLAGRVPEIDGVGLVSMAREQALVPPVGAVSAVLAAAGRDGRRAVIDSGRRVHPALVEATVLVVVAGHLRGLAAARGVLSAASSCAGVVLRRRRGSPVDRAVAERALGVDVVAVVGDDSRLPRLAEQGVPPWSGAGGGWRRACRDIVAVAAA